MAMLIVGTAPTAREIVIGPPWGTDCILDFISTACGHCAVWKANKQGVRPLKEPPHSPIPWASYVNDPMSSHLNRRDSVRYLTTTNRAWLGWNVQGQSAQATGQIMDISHSGTSILLETAPPIGPQEPAWLRMEDPMPSDWVGVVVVSIAVVKKRGLFLGGRIIGHVVRLKFVGPCPYDFFKAATHGDQLSAKFADNGPSDADRVIWR